MGDQELAHGQARQEEGRGHLVPHALLKLSADPCGGLDIISLARIHLDILRYENRLEGPGPRRRSAGRFIGPGSRAVNSGRYLGRQGLAEGRNIMDIFKVAGVVTRISDSPARRW
jgi:hypothetical protein